jgi:hypothetical protein
MHNRSSAPKVVMLFHVFRRYLRHCNHSGKTPMTRGEVAEAKEAIARIRK